MSSPFAQPFLQVSSPYSDSTGWRVVWNGRARWLGFCKILPNGTILIACRLPAEGCPADPEETAALTAALLAGEEIDVASQGTPYNHCWDQVADI